MSIPPTEEIEATDPTHPLFGRRFPCLGVTSKQLLGRVCVVWLAPGVERLIPVAATSLAGVPPPPSACRLSVPAVVALLAVLTSAGTFVAPPSGQEDTDATPQTASPTAPAISSARDSGRAAGPPGSARPAAHGMGRPLPTGTGALPPDADHAVPGGGPCR